MLAVWAVLCRNLEVWVGEAIQRSESVSCHENLEEENAGRSAEAEADL